MSALRSYQQAQRDAAVEGILRGASGLVVSATGTGKTTTARSIADAVGGPALVIVPRVSLARQWAEVAPELQVRTIQSLREAPQGFRLIIADEAHGYGTKRAREVLATDCPRLGLTATPKRLDRLSLRPLFSELWGPAYTLPQALRDGYLVDCRPFRVHVEDGGVEAPAVDSPEHNAQILAHWTRLAGGRKTIAFLPTRAWADHLAETARASGIGAVSLHGASPTTVGEWRASTAPLACSVDQFFEGFDAPEIAAILFVRSTQSERVKVQGIGRALRLSPGKTDAILIDVSGAGDIRWADLYDLDDEDPELDTLTFPRGDPQPMGEALPSLWDVASWAEERAAWSRTVSDARTLPWARVDRKRGGPADVLADSGRWPFGRVLAVRHEGADCAVYLLSWERSGKPLVQRLGRGLAEPDAFRLAEGAAASWALADGADARKAWVQHRRDREPVGPELARALREAGVEVPMTHGEGRRENARAWARGSRHGRAA